VYCINFFLSGRGLKSLNFEDAHDDCRLICLFMTIDSELQAFEIKEIQIKLNSNFSIHFILQHCFVFMQVIFEHLILVVFLLLFLFIAA
jgi:hypothetical protein